jgi:hypothetical protein
MYCTVMAVLVGLQTTPLNYSQAFIADYTVGITTILLHVPEETKYNHKETLSQVCRSLG